MSIFYKVYFTPKNSPTTYGNEIEVSDFVFEDGVPTMRESIDAADYDIGVFNYGDVTIKCPNINGYFNDEMDYRSIFPFGRDKTKVRITYNDDSGEVQVFQGIINEEATRLTGSDNLNEQITFKVLSPDSSIRTTKISGGTVASGVLASSAIFSILNQTEIKEVLNVSEDNINVDFDFNIDNGSAFDNVPTRDGLNQLLLATNSVLIIDESLNVIVKDRLPNEDVDILDLFGPFNINRNQNVLGISRYNTGKHRRFTSVKVNNTERNNTAYLRDFGFQQKKITFDFITSTPTEEAIADRLVNEFKSSKIELNVTVPTYVSRNIKLLDRVKLDYPLRTEPTEGKFFPIVGTSAIGDTETPLPEISGSLRIDNNVAFKVIEKQEKVKSFQTVLKLRQIGNDISDGYFNIPGSPLVGFAIIGISEITGTGDPCDTYNPSILGAAKIGCTQVVL